MASLRGLLTCAVTSFCVHVAAAPCNYAAAYTCASLADAPTLSSFLDDMAFSESRFHKPDVAFDALSAFTYNGHALDPDTGELTGDAQAFSAPSKESLHLSMLALAVSGNARALVFTGGRAAALELLALKAASYARWNATRPGYGCHFPWVVIDPKTGNLAPASDWSSPFRLPALDNGELVWAVLAVVQALAGDATQLVLRGRFQAWFECMAENAATLFYRGRGVVASEVVIRDPTAPCSRANVDHSTSAGQLVDPYEGELYTVLLDLFADWRVLEPGGGGPDMLWEVKRPYLVAVNYTNGDTNITVQRGFWFSAHEQWKQLLLPYTDDPHTRAVFANCERARLADAGANAIPGLFASVNDVITTPHSTQVPDYISASGIQALASQRVTRRDVVTPYAAFVAFLHAPHAAACFYLTMLSGPRMLGPHGSTESASINGSAVCPLLTWDAKITTLLAALGADDPMSSGGVVHLVRAALVSIPTESGETAYDRFLSVVRREHARAFPTLAGVDAPFVLPTAAIPLSAHAGWAATCPSGPLS